MVHTILETTNNDLELRLMFTVIRRQGDDNTGRSSRSNQTIHTLAYAIVMQCIQWIIGVEYTPCRCRIVTSRLTIVVHLCINDTNLIQGTVFTTHGLNYSAVCGRVRGYHLGQPGDFQSPSSRTIDNVYTDGVSITHGNNPHLHIWTYAIGLAYR